MIEYTRTIYAGPTTRLIASRRERLRPADASSTSQRNLHLEPIGSYYSTPSRAVGNRDDFCFVTTDMGYWKQCSTSNPFWPPAGRTRKPQTQRLIFYCIAKHVLTAVVSPTTLPLASSWDDQRRSSAPARTPNLKTHEKSPPALHHFIIGCRLHERELFGCYGTNRSRKDEMVCRKRSVVVVAFSPSESCAAYNPT